jgi:hypothetical protein
MSADLPMSYRFIEDAVCSQVSLAFQYDETVPDVRAHGQRVLSQLAAGTRHRIALELADTQDVSLDVAELSRATLTALCDELILSVLERRGVELRETPLQAA